MTRPTDYLLALRDLGSEWGTIGDPALTDTEAMDQITESFRLDAGDAALDTVIVWRFISVSMAGGAAAGWTTGPRGMSPNHFSTNARVRARSMSPATTRLALFGA